MHKLFLWTGRLIALFFVGSILIAGVVIVLMMRSLPDYEATYSTNKISTPVRIVRDANAVPHITAGTLSDTYFGLGFAHAQDRIWQMNITRRLAQGRLAELVGKRALNNDMLMRSLDLDTYARAVYAAQPQGTKDILQAYARGVNTWISRVGQDGLSKEAPEFLLSKSMMERWQPHDSILLLKSMSFFLSSAAAHEIEQARFALLLSPEDIQDLFASASPSDTSVWRRYAQQFGKQRIMLADRTGQYMSRNSQTGGGASNVWAVSAKRTAYNASLLASDPHLNLQAPAVWYMAHLRSTGSDNTLDVIGATLPGVPVISIGHNNKISWGIAASQIDDQDIYFEKLNPKNFSEYLTPTGYKPFNTRRIKIGVKGSETPVQKTLRWSRHGPVLPETAFNLSDVLPAGHVASLQWTSLTPDDRTITASFDLMQAQTMAVAQEAVERIDTLSLNVVLADQNDVSMLVSGRVPKRSVSNTSKGRLPVEGWLPKNDWLGFLDPADKPRNITPRSGKVANANNQTTDKPYPQHLSYNWAPPYRLARIDKLLNVREYHTLHSFTAMQNDTVSEVARSVLPLVGANVWWDNTDKTQQEIEVLDKFKAWNGDMNEHQMEPLVYVTWMRILTQLLTQDELGNLQGYYHGARPIFLERVFKNTDGAGRWCNVVQTPQQETCAQIAAIALKQTLEELSKRYGNDTQAWRWGKAHQAVHRHTPYGYVPVLKWFFNIRQETSGGDETIMRGLTTGYGSTPDTNVHASGYKMIVDFNDLQRSHYIISTGQSGHPLSQYYDDLSEKWRTGQYIPMLLREDDIQAGSIGTVSLLPSN